MIAAIKATVDDLYRTPGKAELIGGRIVELMATGRKPHRVALRITFSLDEHARRTKVGEAYGDNMGFTVPQLPSGRESFSPDAAYHEGPFPQDAMRFIEGAPKFAAEVRSESDYGPAEELKLADRRADYFQAGTLVVWDIDTVNECIKVYTSSDPEHPRTFFRGEVANAEPAVPGWRIPVDGLFS